MRESNKLAREWLLHYGFDDIWFKPHGKRNDLVFTQKGNYLAQDIWNLFDGICTAGRGAGIWFLQMKTNQWAKEKPIQDFVEKHPHANVLSINVTNKLKECRKILPSGNKSSIMEYKVFVRFYP